MEDHKMDFKSSSLKIRLYDMIQQYSECSTVAGIIYIFMPNQTTVGKIFWILVVAGMITLGTSWSVILYFQWENQPVTTNVLTAALPVDQIEFPAVTICSQGFNYNTFMASLFMLYNDFANYSNASKLSKEPIDAAEIYNAKPAVSFKSYCVLFVK
jgi:hypothetical protein